MANKGTIFTTPGVTQQRFESLLAKNYIGIGQIVGEELSNENIKDKKQTYSQAGTNVLLFRYKVRLCTKIGDNVPNDQVIFAFGQNNGPSGKGGFHFGNCRYPDGEFVEVYQHPVTKQYYIDNSVPVGVGVTLTQNRNGTQGCQPLSGYKPGSPTFNVSLANQGPGGGRPVGEVTPPHTPDATKWDKLYENMPTIELKTPCEPASMAGMGGQISNILREIQDLRTDLLGDDSFLVTSSEFVDQAQSKVDGVASMMTGVMSWLIQEIKKQVMRKINTVVNNTVGAAYLNTRYQIFEGVNSALSACSCAFAAILDTLAQFISDALNNFINDIINPATCAIENFLADLLTQIVNGILSAISGILAGIGNIIGAAIEVVDTILGVVESLLNIFEGCPPQQVCPADKEWNFLDGVAGAGGNPIDIQGIFDKVNSSFSAVSGLGQAVSSFPSTFSGFDFGLDPSSALASAGGCFVGPTPCGPPLVSFFGGGATIPATGVPIVSPSGGIIGVTITSSGFGYSSPPIVSVSDPCGLGVGFIGIASLGPVTVLGSSKFAGGGISTGPYGSGIGIAASGLGTVGPGLGIAGIGTVGPGIGTAGIGIVGIGTAIGLPGPGIGTGGPVVAPPPPPAGPVVAPPPPPAGAGPVVAPPPPPGPAPFVAPPLFPPIAAAASGLPPAGTPAVSALGPLSIGGVGGSPVTSGGVGGFSVTAGGSPVTTGSSGGTTLSAGGLTATGSIVKVGGTGGIQIAAGAAGGTPITCGGVQVYSGATGGTPLVVDPPSTSTTVSTTPSVISGTLTTSIPCLYSSGDGYTGPGLYLDLSGVSGPVNVELSLRVIISGTLEFTIPGIGTLQLVGTGGVATSVESFTLLGGSVYGPCTSTVGNTYAGNQFIAGVPNSGTLPATSAVLVPSGSSPPSWESFVVSTNTGTFSSLVNCTSSSTPSTGVAGVIVLATGFGYLPAPDGTRGANGRVYTERCQTLVQRALGTWDQPYNPGDVITLETGDRIALPGQSEIELGDATIPSQLSRIGAYIVRVNPPLATVSYRSMIGFAGGGGPISLRSMVGFAYTSYGLEGFGLLDLEAARAQGYTDAEVRNYLENDYPGGIIGPRMRDLLNDPTWGNISSATASTSREGWFSYSDYEEAGRQGFTDADVRFYLEKNYIGRISPRVETLLNDPTWGRDVRSFTPRSMVGFDDSAGSETRPNQFGYLNDYPRARAQGFTDYDIRYYLENVYTGSIGAEMRRRLDDPSWGRLPNTGYTGIRQMFGFDDSAGREGGFGYERDYQEARRRGFSDADIRYYLENHYTGTIGPRMREALNDPNFGRIQGINNMAGVPFGTPRDMSGFSDAYGTSGTFGNLDYEEARRQGYSDADIRNYLETQYTGIIGARMQTRLSDPAWGRVQVDRGFSDVPGDPGAFGQLDYEQATRQNQTDYEFLSGSTYDDDRELYRQAVQEGYTDADVRYFLENYYTGEIGPTMQARLDDPNWGRELPTLTSPITTAPPRIRSMVGFNDGPGRRDEFSTADLQEAGRQGFRDVDVRFYLENNYNGFIAEGIRRLLSDPNWGRLGQTITVSLTAPGCPDDVIIENFISASDNVIASLDSAVISDPGFQYDCANDTIEVIPANGAQLEYECVNGSISAVRVVAPGSGYTELPEIRINTNTGYNAKIVPVLGFRTVNTDAIGDGVSPLSGIGVTSIRVVDCVGTIPPRRPLDIVPE